MKKISLLTQITFHIANIILIILYVYPGSILGWLALGVMKKQPQITSDLSYFSTNHVYAFMILSFLGWSSYHMKNVNYLFIYLFFISIFLELCHGIIPQRSFEFKDLFGNILGVLIVFLIFYCFQFLKKKL